MAATHQQQQASSSGPTYDVFLSFHGGDIRTSFADHLYHTLVDAEIRTFRDEERLQKGKEMASELFTSIQQSIISIPVFSRNYAYSKWCLNELDAICECKRTRNQIVFPIFYKVEPTDVRNQTGSYEKAFEEEHLGRCPILVQKWRDALQEIGKLSGWHFKKDTYQGNLLRDVVKKVLDTLKERLVFVSKMLVAIESPKKRMLELLDLECKVTKIVGIHGFGGIGKTTIARVVCEEVRRRFDGYAFVENVREDDEKFGIVYLQNKLIKSILKDGSLNIVDENNGIKVIQQRLNRKRILVVLDDVDQDNQVKSLIGDGEWFGIGSRIIITTRNRDILYALTNEIYEPELMDLDDSLTLFSHHAFKRNQPPEDYLDLSTAIVKTTEGLPLALRVVGSSLFSNSKPIWESMLKKLQKVPNNDVMKRLKISYDGLDYEEQEMFLDAACFFIGLKKDIVCHIWEGCNFVPEVGLDVLCSKSLIEITKDGELRMHDMLRDLGRQIVLQENAFEPNKCSRIWSEWDIWDVLFEQQGTIDCLGFAIDFKKSNIDSKKKLMMECSMSSGLDAMTGLRLLQLDHAQILGNCVNSFSELRWLSWKGCPEQYALTNFCPETLVVLDLSYSEITENWKGWNHIKVAVSLKVLKLDACKQLCITPDLSKNRVLELLSFNDCVNLVGIDTSIGSLMRLVTLDLRGCSSLVDLPIEIGYLTSLVTLDMVGCKSLVEFSIEICQFTSLKTLVLHRLQSLIRLDLGRMTSLTILELAYCHSLKDISSLSPGLISIEISDCESISSIRSLPSGLTILSVCDCESLEEIEGVDEKLESLEECKIFWCRSLKQLPKLMCSKNLRSLSLSRLDAMSHFEGKGMESLEKLHIYSCNSLKKIPYLKDSKGLWELSIMKCLKLTEIECLEGYASLQKLSISKCKSLTTLSDDISSLKNLRELELEACKKLSKIPGLSRLESLQKLKIERCQSLAKLDGVDELKALCSLSITECWSLDRLPALSNLKNLKYLRVNGCKNLPEVSQG